MDKEKLGEIKEIKDLRGKRVGVVKGSASHYFLLKVLKENNIDPETIEIIHLDVIDQLLALISNQIDAV